MSKPAAKSLVLLVAAIVGFYWKLVFTRQFSMVTNYETVSQAYSWFHFWAVSIRHGVWPLWDPYMFGGRSFAGEMQTAVFYPLHLVFALFGPDRNGLLPEWLFHGYFVFAHALAAVCMFALIRELGLSDFSALLGGLCFSVGGFMGQAPWLHLLESAGWTPVLFLLVLRAWKATERRRAILYAALAGVVLGLSILAGGLHIVFMQAILLVAAGIFQAFQQRPAGPGWRRPLAVVAMVLLFGLAAGAVQLAPSAEYSAHAMRYVSGGPIPATQKIAYANLDEIPPRLLANYLFFSNSKGTMAGVEVLDPYPGVFPLLLAVIGFWKGRGIPWARFAAGLVLIAFLYSLGQSSWLYGVLYAWVPLLWMAREASRFLFLAHFGLVILTAYGCEVLFSAPQKLLTWTSLNRVYLCIVAGCALILAAPAVLGTPPLTSSSEISLLMILLTYPLFRWIAGGAVGLAPRVLTVLLIVFNLSAFSFVAPNKIQVARTGTDYLEQMRGLRGVVDFLHNQPGLFRVRVLTDPGLNIGDAYGIQTLNGGAVTLANTFFGLMNQSSAGPRLLNSRYIVRPAAVTDPDPVYSDANWKVYADPQALPRAWVVHETVVEPSHVRLLERLGAPDLDLTRSALLSTPLPAPLEPSADANADQAVIKSYAAEEITLQVHAGSRGLMVLSELYDRGWSARVDGAPQPIYEVDGGLRGIIAPSGSSQVVLEYAPESVRVGAIVSAVAFLGTLLAWIFWGRKPGTVSSNPDFVSPEIGN